LLFVYSRQGALLSFHLFPSTSNVANAITEMSSSNDTSDLSGRGPTSVIFEGTSLVAGERILIDNATGHVSGGRLAAIVSACGSRGDLLMLELLAGMEKPTSGTMVANCVPIGSSTYQQSSAFVSTGSAMHAPAAGEQLSVFDNLTYSLRMRSKSRGGPQEARSRIEHVLRQLAMQDVTDRPVAELRVGDRVKLSIAMELVLQPDFVYIDFALNVVDTPQICELLFLLGEIARTERIVIAVALVQPRWLLLEYFDDVLLMEHSRLYYCGTRADLLPLLYEAETYKPNSFSGSDSLRMGAQLLSDGGGGGSAAGARTALQQQQELRHPESCLNALYIICASTRPSDLLEPPGFAAARAKIANEVADRLRDTANGRVPIFEPRAGSDAGVHPSFFVKLFYMMLYGVYRARQQVLVNTVFFVIAFTLFLLLGKIYGSVMNESDELDVASQTIQNGAGLLFFFVSLAFLYNLLFIEPFREQLFVFQRHRSQGYYDTAHFLIYLVMSNGIVRTIFALLIILGLYIVDPLLGFAGLQHLVVVLGFMSFATLGIAWACIAIFPNAKQFTVYVFVATYAVSALFGGLFINLLSLPDGLRQISRVSMVRLAFESLLVGQFTNRSLGCNETYVPPGSNTTSTTQLPMTSTTGEPTLFPPALRMMPTTAASPEEVDSRLFEHAHRVAHIQARGDDVSNYLGAAPLCVTGDGYIASVGFELSNKWENLIPITYIFLAFFGTACIGVFWHRKKAIA
jgi:ABC-type multidrug transport system ATPase subunit